MNAAGRRSARTGVFGFAALTAVSAVVLVTIVLPRVPVAPGAEGRSPFGVLTWVVTAAFLLAERCAVDFEVRDRSYSVSIGDIPFVVGLFLLPPGGLVVTSVVAAAVTVLLERPRALAAAYDAAMGVVNPLLLLSIVAISLPEGADPASPAAWLVATSGMLLVALLTGTTVHALMRLMGESADRIDAARTILAGTVAVLANTSIAIVSVAVLQVSAAGLVSVSIIIATVVIAYRAYGVLNQRYAGLRQVYEFTNRLDGTTEAEQTIRTVVTAAADALRAEEALLVLLGDGLDRQPRAVRLDAAHLVHAESGREWAADPLVAGALAGESARLLRNGRALAAPLKVGTAVIGALALEGRRGAGAPFDAGDVESFGALANHAAVALEHARLILRLRDEIQEKEHQALHDVLTGLPNRRLFNRSVDEAVREGHLDGTPVAVLQLDLNEFKDVNDTLGHHAGDLLLREVAERLVTAVPDATCVARMNGDEFGLVVPGLDAPRADLLAEVVLHVLSEPMAISGVELAVRAAVGIACFPEHGADGSLLVQRADVAMYQAKSRRERPVALYDSESDRGTARRLTLATDLPGALERGELEVHYQPQVDFRTGRVVGAEALLRWTHPTLGRVPPDELVAVAAHVGLINHVTRYVLRRAVAQCQRWHESGRDLEVSVNVSARNLVEDTLAAEVLAALARSGLDPSVLTLEITETELMADPERTMAVVEALAEAGVSLAIDDFGTGYSSMAYLRRLPVREVKIDKSFVMAIADDPNDAAIARSIIDLAAALGLRVVAEGIEDQSSWNVLLAMGCDRGQGYFLSHPLSGDAMVAWLDDRVRPRS